LGRRFLRHRSRSNRGGARRCGSCRHDGARDARRNGSRFGRRRYRPRWHHRGWRWCGFQRVRRFAGMRVHPVWNRLQIHNIFPLVPVFLVAGLRHAPGRNHRRDGGRPRRNRTGTGPSGRTPRRRRGRRLGARSTVRLLRHRRQLCDIRRHDVLDLSRSHKSRRYGLRRMRSCGRRNGAAAAGRNGLAGAWMSRRRGPRRSRGRWTGWLHGGSGPDGRRSGGDRSGNRRSAANRGPCGTWSHGARRRRKTASLRGTRGNGRPGARRFFAEQPNPLLPARLTAERRRRPSNFSTAVDTHKSLHVHSLSS
jgi:hypothetical protein